LQEPLAAQVLEERPLRPVAVLEEQEVPGPRSKQA